MTNLSNIVKLLFLSANLASVAAAQGSAPGSLSLPNDAVVVTSPDGRYVARFSAARSEGKEDGKLWGSIAVRDLRTGLERILRSAAGQRGKGVFEGFSLYDDANAWSPDNLYLAYYQNSCIDEPAVEGGVVCHVHEIRFLQLKQKPLCVEEITLGRYGFGGWVRGRAHTPWEIDAEGRRVKRNLCASGR
ncbi:MAG TPA: hypothetical protein VM911_17380 [Pyrinomonadaceae bacterium]|jgi:hypothetical protein|nr:hypothetical protein [Pyrinomonadaceae bacterium]